MASVALRLPAAYRSGAGKGRSGRGRGRRRNEFGRKTVAVIRTEC